MSYTDVNAAVAKLNELEATVAAYSHAMGVLSVDASTAAPARSAEGRGRTMMGNSVEDIVEELEALGVDGVGLNCSQGPETALPVILEFAEKTELPLVFKPNAGNPVLAEDGSVISAYDAEHFVQDVEAALDQVAYIGGCCGSSPEYIRALKARLRQD